MSLAQVVSTVAAAVLSLWVRPNSREGIDLKWTGLWGEGHMNSVEIRRPLYAVILAKALSCLQDANEQVK